MRDWDKTLPPFLSPGRADERIDISAAEIRVDGEEKVQITCGGSNINMTPGGVRINGSDIRIG